MTGLTDTKKFGNNFQTIIVQAVLTKWFCQSCCNDFAKIILCFTRQYILEVTWENVLQYNQAFKKL